MRIRRIIYTYVQYGRNEMMEKIAAMLLFMSFLFVLYFSIMVSINKSFDEALDMGRLLERLKKTCSQCESKTFPRRINGRYADGEAERVYLWQCRQCSHIWIEHK